MPPSCSLILILSCPSRHVVPAVLIGYRLSALPIPKRSWHAACQRRRVLDQSRVEKGELLITVVKHTHSRNAWPIATATLSVQTRLFGLACLAFFRLISSHTILFILPALHYSCCQPNTLEMACYCLSRHDLGFFFSEGREEMFANWT